MDLSGGGPSRREQGNRNQNPPVNSGLAPVIAAHYNTNRPDGIEARKNSRIFHLRNFNNWIKSGIIEEQLKIVKTNLSENTRDCSIKCKVLDLCCGKGGDLKKWMHGKVGHVIFADIAETSVGQCKERYNEMKRKDFSVEFIVADCTRTRLREKMKDVTMQLDLVSCQFAFHYCFESLPQAMLMLKNASECLRPGGRFIGTIPNATEIVRKMRMHQGKQFGNEVYTITPHCQEPYPLFGAKYDFQLEGVVNCPEFLVHFPTFVELARKHGLKLISVYSFPKYFTKLSDTSRRRLEMMSGLESFPAAQRFTLSGGHGQYLNASRAVHPDTGIDRVGTMSSDEWEVCTLYIVFVFEKVKLSIYDARGNPIYDFS